MGAIENTPRQAGKPSVKRVLTRADLILYGLVILTPTAPYPVYGIIQQESRGHAAISYLVAMIAMLFTAGSYAKMATAYPSAGSTYTYVQRSLNPYLGFLAGWAMILDYFLIPLESIIYAALTAARLAPVIPYVAWVILFVGLMTFINVRGMRLMNRANTLLMALMTGCALLFLACCLHYIMACCGASGLLSQAAIYKPETFALRPVMLGAAIATLSYIGFDAISTLAEESITPRRDIGYSTIIVCLLQTMICVATVYLAARVWPEYGSFPQADTAILDLGQRVGGALLLAALTFVLLVAGLASGLTGQAGASRLLFAMGRDQALPAFFGNIHPSHLTPTNSIYTVAFVCLVGAITMRFQIAVELLNFGAFAGFVLVNLSVIRHYFIRLRLRDGKGVVFNLICPLLGALVCSYVWMSLTTKAKLVGFLWLLIGAAYLARLTKGFRLPPNDLGLGNAA